MAKKGTNGGQDSFAETCSSIISGTISIFMLILVTVFPLIYDNSYVNILETKYKCYYMTVIGMLAVVLVLALVMLVIDMNEFKGEHAARLFASLAPKNWKKTFCAADVAVLVFWLVSLISTLQSEYLFEAFWGNEGRYTGLFLLTLYVAAYFVISRCWRLKGWVLELFLISGLIMCYIGITDYFQMDILHFRGRIKPEQSTIFTSTVGNINTYTAYVGLLMGVAAAMFATSKSLLRSIWYYLCLVVTFFAIIMGCSDNAYLAIGALFAFLPFLLFKSRKGIFRYLVILASFVTVIQCIDYINQAYAEVVIGLDSLFKVLVNFRGLLPVTAALWGLAGGYYVIAVLGAGKSNGVGNSMGAGKSMGEGKGKGAGTPAGTLTSGSEDRIGNGFLYAWSAILIIGFLAVCFMLYDANIAGNSARYGSLGSYLVFNDSWGTNRGYIWKASLRLYRDFPLMHKLFGYGPDTFGILTTTKIHAEMIAATGQRFDSAHNEYLQYLITIGPIGLAAYVVFLVSAGRQMMKRIGQNPYVAGCLVAVLCYGVQALVNLNLPIATPVMWLLLSAGMAKAAAGGNVGNE